VTDLVKRLRPLAVKLRRINSENAADEVDEAADYIEKLEARVKRLEGAVRWIRKDANYKAPEQFDRNLTESYIQCMESEIMEAAEGGIPEGYTVDDPLDESDPTIERLRAEVERLTRERDTFGKLYDLAMRDVRKLSSTAEAAEASNLRMVEALRGIEWSAYDETSGDPRDNALCPECRARRPVNHVNETGGPRGHEEDCLIGRCIAWPALAASPPKGPGTDEGMPANATQEAPAPGPSEGARLAMTHEALATMKEAAELVFADAGITVTWPHEVLVALAATEADVTAFLEGVRRQALERKPWDLSNTDPREEREQLADDAMRLADMLNAVGMPQVSGVYAGALLEGLNELLVHFRRIRSLGAARPPLGDPREPAP